MKKKITLVTKVEMRQKEINQSLTKYKIIEKKKDKRILLDPQETYIFCFQYIRKFNMECSH